MSWRESMIRSGLNSLNGSPRKFQDPGSEPHAQRHALTAIPRRAFSFGTLRQANVCCIEEVALALQPLHHSLLPSSTPPTSTVRSESSDHQISRIFNIILSRLFRLDSHSQTVDIALWFSRDIYNNQLQNWIIIVKERLYFRISTSAKRQLRVRLYSKDGWTPLFEQ